MLKRKKKSFKKKILKSKKKPILKTHSKSENTHCAWCGKDFGMKVGPATTKYFCYGGNNICSSQWQKSEEKNTTKNGKTPVYILEGQL
jgi:hypothetical protein